ncbi:MAG TPA: SWIM zinc finger family protein, partial [Tepidisphaeraceae bacterium]|nr:SWIM zinc finger family protein [Tepidisphaeraceae bacterium]
ELYEITIGIKALAPAAWDAVKRQCAGQIGSVIELLQGRLSQAVMQIITRREGGLFPKPAEIDLRCSCPDWAGMCKHVAAALYGVGARLDQHPELLFVLRKVDPLELIGQAGDIRSLTRRKGAAKTIAAGALADVFGIELEVPEAAAEPAALIRKGTRRPARAAKATVGAKAPAAPAAKKSAKPGGASGRRGPDARPPSRPSRNGRAVRR